MSLLICCCGSKTGGMAKKTDSRSGGGEGKSSGCPPILMMNNNNNNNNNNQNNHNNAVAEPLVLVAKEDPRIGLNKRQIFILTKNWKGISRKIESTGVTMFVKMFEDNPYLFNIFHALSHLRDAPKEQLLENELLEGHAGSVMVVFNEAITNIGNPDAFFAVLHKYAAMHAKKPGFDPQNFRLMEKPMLFAIKITLDDRYTDNMDDIYRKIVHLIVETMVAECAANLSLTISTTSPQTPRAIAAPAAEAAATGMTDSQQIEIQV